jgi:hypothetical protein
MDLQVGAVSKFNVTKTGAAYGTLIGSSTATFGISAATGIGFYSSNRVSVLADGQIAMFFGSSQNIIANGRSLSFESGASGAGDTIMLRDAAYILAQRNGVNAQTFRVYKTYTDASNYERGVFDWTTTADTLTIAMQRAGTGTARVINFVDGGGTTRVSIAATSGVVTVGNVDISTSASVSFLGSSTSGFAFRYASGANSDLLIRFAGITSSFPALKRTTTSLQARLADDTAFTNIQGKLTTDTAYTAGALVATGYITIYDSTGTAYRVPCLV